jgi:carbon storage regulator
MGHKISGGNIMLVLSRRDGQEIVLGDDIVIKVLSIDGGRVRIGIEAPQSVQVRRSELPVKPQIRALSCWKAADHEVIGNFAVAAS